MGTGKTRLCQGQDVFGGRDYEHPAFVRFRSSLRTFATKEPSPGKVSRLLCLHHGNILASTPVRDDDSRCVHDIFSMMVLELKQKNTFETRGNVF